MTTYAEVRAQMNNVPGFSEDSWRRRVEVINVPKVQDNPDGSSDPLVAMELGDRDSDDWLKPYIAAALRLHSRDSYCTALLTAHLYVLAQDGPKDGDGNMVIDMPDAGGSVASGLSVGNLSTSYQRSSEEGSEWYDQTSYGRQFRMMERRVNADRVRVV